MAKEILTTNNVMLNAHPKDKWEAIRLCGQLLVDNGYVHPDYIQDMFEREKTASVYIGNQIAIPHGREKSEHNIYESGISVVQVPDGIDFAESPDADPATAYVFIGIAGKNNTHLDILGNIALVCCDMDNVEILKTTQDKQVIVDMLKDVQVL